MSIFIPQQPEPSAKTVQETSSAEKWRKAGLILLAIAAGLPLLAGLAIYLLRGSIDTKLHAWAAAAREPEAIELHDELLNRFNRKMQAIWFTLEPQPFVTFSPPELNGYLLYLSSIGKTPRAFRSIQLAFEKDRVKVLTGWSGPELADLIASWGYSPTGTVSGPMLGYLRQLHRFQFEVWVRPRAEKGFLTWDIERGTVNDTQMPPDLLAWMEGHLMSGGKLLTVGPPAKQVQEVKAIPQGLWVKWTRKPARA